MHGQQTWVNNLHNEPVLSKLVTLTEYRVLRGKYKNYITFFFKNVYILKNKMKWFHFSSQ